MKTFLLFWIIPFILGSSLAFLQLQIPQLDDAEDSTVEIHHFRPGNSESEKYLELSALGKRYHLNLRRAQPVYSPDFKLITARQLQNGYHDVSELRIPNSLKEELGRSTYSVDGGKGYIYLEEGGDVKIEGMVDENIRIFRDHDSALHKAVNVEKHQREEAVDYVMPNYTEKNFGQLGKRQTVDPVTVEVLVLVDHANSKHMRFDRNAILRYLAVYWNSVQRRYFDASNPRVRFSISGVIVFTRPQDEPFVKNSMARTDQVDAYRMLDGLKTWLYNMRQTVPKFDLAIAQTRFNMANNLAGLAHVGSVCNVDNQQKIMWNTGVGVDVAPYYSGVLTTAHEVAHLLNVPHDGDKDSASCAKSTGYIMGSSGFTENSWKFSSCSLRIMSAHIRSSARCLQDSPLQTVKLSNQLPGQVISLNQACQSQWGNNFQAYPKDDVCRILWCGTGNGKLTSKGGAPEGSPCQRGKICRNGRCE